MNMDKPLNKTNIRLIAGVSGLTALLLLTAAAYFFWPVAFDAVSKAALYGLLLVSAAMLLMTSPRRLKPAAALGVAAVCAALLTLGVLLHNNLLHLLICRELYGEVPTFGQMLLADLRYPYGLRLWRYGGFAILSFAVCAWALMRKEAAERDEC